jgi:hypothetical protein
MHGTENTMSNSSFIVACVFVAVGMFLTNRCIAILEGGDKDTETAKLSHKSPLLILRKFKKII